MFRHSHGRRCIGANGVNWPPPPRNMDENLKPENMQNMSSFLGTSLNRCTKRRIRGPDSIKFRFKNAPFQGQIFKNFFASGCKGVGPPWPQAQPKSCRRPLTRNRCDSNHKITRLFIYLFFVNSVKPFVAVACWLFLLYMKQTQWMFKAFWYFHSHFFSNSKRSFLKNDFKKRSFSLA